MDSVDLYKTAIGKLYDLIDEFSKFGEKIPTPKNEVDAALIGNLAAIIEKSEAIKELYSKGHYNSADILIRVITEHSIQIICIAEQGQETVDRLKINALYEAISKNKFAIDKGLFLSLEEKSKFNELINKYKTKIKEIEKKYNWNKPKKGKVRWKPYVTSTKQFYNLASSYPRYKHLNLDEEYLTYKILCNRAHSNLAQIFKDHLRSIKDGFVDIGKPLSPKEFYISIVTLSQMILNASYAINTHFYDEEKQIQDIYKKYLEIKQVIDEN